MKEGSTWKIKSWSSYLENRIMQKMQIIKKLVLQVLLNTTVEIWTIEPRWSKNIFLWTMMLEKSTANPMETRKKQMSVLKEMKESQCLSEIINSCILKNFGYVLKRIWNVIVLGKIEGCSLRGTSWRLWSNKVQVKETSSDLSNHNVTTA